MRTIEEFAYNNGYRSYSDDNHTNPYVLKLEPILFQAWSAGHTRAADDVVRRVLNAHNNGNRLT